MTNKSRSLSLFERLTWRLRLLSGREWAILAVAAIALLGYGVYATGRSGVCTGERLQMQLDLERSNREIAAVPTSDRGGQCAAYRHRRDLLARDLANPCGLETSARSNTDAFAERSAQIRFYTSLLERKCPDAAP